MKSLGIVFGVCVAVVLLQVGIGYSETYYGTTDGTGASDYGVKGEATSSADGSKARGVIGITNCRKGIGVLGQAKKSSGKKYGVKGVTKSITTGTAGVFGLAAKTVGTIYGVYGKTNSITGRGVYGEAPEAAAGNFGNYGVYGKTSTGAIGGGELNWGAGVRGEAAGTTGLAVGVYGTNASTTPGTIAVFGYHIATEGSSKGVYGYVQSTSTGSAGVWGVNTATDGTNYGVYGQANSASGYGGYFSGRLHCTGALSKGSGEFVQPHRYNPKKEIHYAFFEGPEHAVFLRGTAQLKGGKAVIETPEHFRVVVAKEGILVQLTPQSIDSRGLAIVSKNKNKIVVGELFDGKGNYQFDYFITAKRAGFEEFVPVQENKHFRVDGKTKEEFEESYNKDTLTMNATREMLISNGIMTKDGKLNMEMAKELGWKLKEESQKLASK